MPHTNLFIQLNFLSLYSKFLKKHMTKSNSDFSISTFAATAIFSFEDKVYMQIMPLLFNFIKLLSKKN